MDLISTSVQWEVRGCDKGAILASCEFHFFRVHVNLVQHPCNNISIVLLLYNVDIIKKFHPHEVTRAWCNILICHGPIIYFMEESCSLNILNLKFILCIFRYSMSLSPPGVGLNCFMLILMDILKIMLRQILMFSNKVKLAAV